MNRLPDWEQRLHDVIAANLTRPHEYGQHDCLLWPAAVVEAITGEDLGTPHRGKYDSLAKAYRYLGKLGFDSPTAFLDSLFDEKPVGFAGRGDLVLVEIPEAIAPGGISLPAVVIGDHALAIVADAADYEGLARFPRSLWRKAWAVGEHHSGDFA